MCDDRCGNCGAEELRVFFSDDGDIAVRMPDGQFNIAVQKNLSRTEERKEGERIYEQVSRVGRPSLSQSEYVKMDDDLIRENPNLTQVERRAKIFRFLHPLKDNDKKKLPTVVPLNAVNREENGGKMKESDGKEMLRRFAQQNSYDEAMVLGGLREATNGKALILEGEFDFHKELREVKRERKGKEKRARKALKSSIEEPQLTLTMSDLKLAQGALEKKEPERMPESGLMCAICEDNCSWDETPIYELECKLTAPKWHCHASCLEDAMRKQKLWLKKKNFCKAKCVAKVCNGSGELLAVQKIKKGGEREKEFIVC